MIAVEQSYLPVGIFIVNEGKSMPSGMVFSCCLFGKRPGCQILPPLSWSEREMREAKALVSRQKDAFHLSWCSTYTLFQSSLSCPIVCAVACLDGLISQREVARGWINCIELSSSLFSCLAFSYSVSSHPRAGCSPPPFIIGVIHRLCIFVKLCALFTCPVLQTLDALLRSYMGHLQY